MEQWIVVFTMLTGRHAVGGFNNEQTCLRWFVYWQQQVDQRWPGTVWLGTCYREKEFKEKFPGLRLAEES